MPLALRCVDRQGADGSPGSPWICRGFSRKDVIVWSGCGVGRRLIDEGGYAKEGKGRGAVLVGVMWQKSSGSSIDVLLT